MRLKRSLQLMPEHGSKGAIYHCISRTVWRKFLFEDEEKEYLASLIRQHAKFCGVRVLTYCLMNNHFHILVEIPPKQMADDVAEWHDEAFLSRLLTIYSEAYVEEVRGLIDQARNGDIVDENGERSTDAYVRELKLKYTRRMCDLSEFIKVIKQKFTMWYNRRNGLGGTLWEGRFKSQLIQGGEAARTVAAYIDLNPVRAGIVDDPKDYHWSGYGEAVAGIKEAQLGILRVMQKKQREFPNHVVASKWREVMGDYRMALAVGGMKASTDAEVGSAPIQGERASGRYKKRKGLSKEEVEEILESGGKLGRADLLMCKVRYFSDGVVLGSRKFVNDFFKQLKSGAEASEGYSGQYRQRKTGARKMRGIDFGLDKSEADLPERSDSVHDNLCTMRDLRKDVYG